MPSVSRQWLQVSVSADRKAADDLVRILSMNCTGGAAIEDSASSTSVASERVTIKGWMPIDDEETRRKLEIALLLLSRDGSISEPTFQELAYEDWATSWKQYFQPLCIGERIVVVPSWCDYTPRPNDLIITLDPGMAFGTGLHATTRLCLKALDKYPPANQRVLDVGCGSGILAIAAALHGASQVDAIDNDQLAVTAARENITRNQFAQRIRVVWATLPGTTPGAAPIHSDTGYDLVLANILAEIIVSMAPALAKATKPGGVLVMSGILKEKASMVSQEMARVGVEITGSTSEDDWVALIGQKQ